MHSLILSAFIMGALFFLAPLKSEARSFHSEGDTLTKKSDRSIAAPLNHKSAAKPSSNKIQKQLYRRLPPDQLKKAPEGACLPANDQDTLNNNYIAFTESKK
jgi:hypothetical protein